MITAKIVADSIGPHGHRLTTVEATYPRIIHEEVLTHRIISTDPQAWAELSRNSASSRAIPTSRWISAVSSSPFIPTHWFANKSGMQSGNELSSDLSEAATEVWLTFRDQAMLAAKQLNQIGVHKHHANRPLQIFQHITTVMTATEWQNFFGLRYHPAAAPEFIELAGAIYNEYSASDPEILDVGQWHLPYILTKEMETLPYDEQIKRSVARCGRVSYLRQGEASDYDTELDRADEFVTSGHWSATEHTAMTLPDPTQVGNLTGFKQYRKFFTQEAIAPFNPPAE
jgi:hypothetical protein